LAAKLRDEISKLEAESLTTSIRAQAYENAQYAFRLGQKVKHKNFGMESLTNCLEWKEQPLSNSKDDQM